MMKSCGLLVAGYGVLFCLVAMANVGGALRHRRVLPLPLPVATNAGNTTNCPCSDQSLCAPIAVNRSKEVFVFQVDRTNWRWYDWLKVTTVVLYDGFDADMYCFAHSLSVRVVIAAGYSASKLLNETERHHWIQQQLATVEQYSLDGVNVDFEDPVADGSPEKAALTSLVAELGRALRSGNPKTQLTFDVAWRPHGIDGRFYDYAALAKLTDFLVIMDYDTRSQIFNVTTCVAGANAPAYTVLDGIREYLLLHDEPSKYVLGVPWYGYEYGCVNTYAGPGTECVIPRTIPPWRGCNCSDAAGREVCFSGLTQLVLNETNGSYPLAPLVVNTTAAGGGLYAKLDFVVTGGSAAGGWYQAWFDSPETTAVKYRIAKHFDLRGISMWNVDCLSSSPTGAGATLRTAMWDAMDAYLL